MTRLLEWIVSAVALGIVGCLVFLLVPICVAAMALYDAWAGLWEVECHDES